MLRLMCLRIPRALFKGLSIGVVVLSSSQVIRAAPLTFNTALPVAENEFVIREQFIFNRSSADPSTADRKRAAWSIASAVGYGVNSDLAIFGVLPYANKQLKMTSGAMRVTRQAEGFGDFKIFGRYTVLKKNSPGKNFRIAPFAGIEIPTGANTVRDALGRLPAGVQPGSGSWDVFGGAVATYQTLDFQFDAQARYQANAKADGFEFGDVARFDGSFQYRLWPRTLRSGVPGFFYGILETNIVHKQTNRIGGARDFNSGGTTVFLVPGVQYVTKRWIVETALQVPIVQNLHGAALKNDFILRAGFRFNI